MRMVRRLQSTSSRRHQFRPSLQSLENRYSPAAGMLDPTFGVGGQVTTRLSSPSQDSARATAIDSLGRIIVAGYTENGSNLDFAVARFTPAGTLDMSFGGIGQVSVDFRMNNDFAYSVAVDSLNRIVVAGETWDGSGGNDFGVARFTTSGVLDTSFDGDGKQIVNFGASDSVSGVAIDSLNRVLIVGGMSNGTNRDFAVVRLTGTGALDSSFDGDGKLNIDFGSREIASGVAVDSLGRIVVAGTAFVSGAADDFAVTRLTNAGALDNSFDIDGKQIIDFDSGRAASVAVDSLDRVVIAGQAYIGDGPSDFAVVRLTVAGALDSSFDGDGKKTVGLTWSDTAYAVTIDSLNRVVLAGDTTEGNGDSLMTVVRLTDAGALDGSFDSNGVQMVDFGVATQTAFGVAVDSLDRIVIVGHRENASSIDFMVARLTASGLLDTSFDGDGKLILGLNNASNVGVGSVAIDSQGRIVAAGGTYNGISNQFVVARYTNAGVLDPTFGGTGIVTFSFGSPYESAGSVAIDSLGRIVVAGSTNAGGGNQSVAVARLTPAGVLDTNFDGDGKQTIDFGTQEDVGDVAIDSFDRVVLSSRAITTAGYDFGVARLTVAGALDASFDGDGKQTIDFGTSEDLADGGVAIDSMNRVVVAGTIQTGSVRDFALARLTVAGALDTTFDGDGRQTIGFGATDDVAGDVIVDSLDRVVVTGHTRNGPNSDFAVARLTVSGVLDSSFDSDGKQTINFGLDDGYSHEVALDSLGRIMVAGYTGTGTQHDFAVARLTTVGALDASFDGDGKQTIDFVADDYLSGMAIASANRTILAGQTNNNGQLIALARLTGDTTTTSAQINDGTVQRSRVSSLTIRFSGQVTFGAPPAQAFAFARIGGNAVNYIASVSMEYGGTVVTLSNFTGSETEYGSLRDGRYTLTAIASHITADGQMLDGDANGTPGDNFVFGDAQGLFRFFGDINGDRRVSIADYGLFSLSYLNAANYVAAFDFNGDGRINIADYGQFSLRYLAMLP